MTEREGLRDLLAATTLPAALADDLVAGAPDLWISSDGAAALATDLALAHPPLRDGEVRARVAVGDGGWRLTVVAADRPGLLADTAGALAAEGCSVAMASVASWQPLGLALHSVTVRGGPPPSEVLERIGAALRSPASASASARFVAVGTATVVHSGTASGDPIVTLTAPDQPGLLWAACRWFADHDVSIQAAWISGGGDEPVTDVFIVRGDVDIRALERHLSGSPDPPRRRRVVRRPSPLEV